MVRTNMVKLLVFFLGTCALAGLSANDGNVFLKWVPPVLNSVNQLGLIVAVDDVGTQTVLLAPALMAGKTEARLTGIQSEQATDRVRLTFSEGGKRTTLALSVHQQAGQFFWDIEADSPGLTSIDVGPWLPGTQARNLQVPYYTGIASWLAAMSKFGGFWWDWKVTDASYLDARKVVYKPKTDGTYNVFKERLVIVVSSRLSDIFPEPGNPASPYLSDLSGRVVLDVWGRSFSSIKNDLHMLSDYGLRNGALIIHNWQHFGYDNGLPQHFPANEALGGDEALLDLVAEGVNNGHRVALHENYVDYYPNFPGFDPAAIALESDGSQKKAWFNKSTGIRAFATKPGLMVQEAAGVSPEIRRLYGTNAVFIDVNSSTSISNHGDFDVQVPEAAKLRLWTANNEALWKFERAAHNGPCFGEGLQHWYYSGLLDGVEAQTGTGTNVAQNTGAAIPLFVDFDLRRIHPLQVNHGVGYYERWTQAGASINDTVQMDAYRMQEIAFGHAPFVGNSLWNDLRTAFTEFNLVSPVARRYGTAKALTIEYQVDDAWVPGEIAAAKNDFSCVRTTWDSGMSVLCNASEAPVKVGNIVVPQYGWYASGHDIQAYSAQRDGHFVDYCETPTSVFANARNRFDAENKSAAYAKPEVLLFSMSSPRTLQLTLDWEILNAIPTGYKVFVHFVKENANTQQVSPAFQGDHALVVPTAGWKAGAHVVDGPVKVTIPSMATDGLYSLRVGLYKPDSPRLALLGHDDSAHRIVLGTLTISNKGTQVGFEREKPSYDKRLNDAGTIVDFGPVRTDGMVSVVRDGQDWIVYAVPSDRAFTLEFDVGRFAQPDRVQVFGGEAKYVGTTKTEKGWTFALQGAKSYRWRM